MDKPGLRQELLKWACIILFVGFALNVAARLISEELVPLIAVCVSALAVYVAINLLRRQRDW